MCFVFFLQYLDKQSLSYASVGSSVPGGQAVRERVVPDEENRSSA